MTDFIIDAKLSLQEIHDKYYPKIQEGDFYTLVAADPTFSEQKKLMGFYGKFILGLYQRDPSILGRLAEVRDVLVRRQFLIESGLTQADDVMDYRSFDGLAGAVREDEQHNFVLLYAAGSNVLVRTLTKKANEVFGCGASWCTTWDNPMHWEKYNKGGFIWQLIMGWNGEWSIPGLKTGIKFQMYVARDGSHYECRNIANDLDTNESMLDWTENLGSAGTAWEKDVDSLGLDHEEIEELEADGGNLNGTVSISPLDAGEEIYLFEDTYNFSVNFTLENDDGEVDAASFEGQISTALSDNLAVDLSDLIEMDVNPFIPFFVAFNPGALGRIPGMAERLQGDDFMVLNGDWTAYSIQGIAKGLGMNRFGGFVFNDTTTEAANAFKAVLEGNVHHSWANSTVVELSSGRVALVVHDAQDFGYSTFFTKGELDGSATDALKFLARYRKELPEQDGEGFTALVTFLWEKYQEDPDDIYLDEDGDELAMLREAAKLVGLEVA